MPRFLTGSSGDPFDRHVPVASAQRVNPASVSPLPILKPSDKGRGIESGAESAGES
jgi:hypothetical protein